MGKYIWPHKLGEATLWYLRVLSGKQKLSIDALLEEQVRLKNNRHDRLQMRRQLDTLTKKGLVKKYGNYRTVRYKITPEGVRRLESLNLSKLQAKPFSWDGKWRLVFFDIPEDTRSARDQIRRLLRELGFEQLQLSVWVHPLPCLDYFREIQEAYGIVNHIFLAQTSEINIPREIIAHFQRQYPKQSIK